MTRLELWRRVNRRAASLSPALAADLLRAFRTLGDAVGEAAVAKLVEQGYIDAVVDLVASSERMDAALVPARERLRGMVASAVTLFGKDIPRVGDIERTIAVAMDWLNPTVITAIRALETKVMRTLAESTRETVRAYIETALRDGVNPRVVARSLRSVIGLAPNQEAAVRNFQAALESGKLSKVTQYALRDRRFDRTIAQGNLTPEQIERMVATYRRRFVAWNAETNARTAALDAQKLGQRLSWEDAARRGIVDGDRLEKTWSGVLDNREREEHLRMEGQTVPADSRFSNGEFTPGDSTFNCRCIAVYRVGPPRRF